MFLLFSLGLEFSLRKLARVGVTAVVAALAEIILMIWIGYMIGGLFGWKPMDALFLGESDPDRVCRFSDSCRLG